MDEIMKRRLSFLKMIFTTPSEEEMEWESILKQIEQLEDTDDLPSPPSFPPMPWPPKRKGVLGWVKEQIRLLLSQFEPVSTPALVTLGTESALEYSLEPYGLHLTISLLPGKGYKRWDIVLGISSFTEEDLSGIPVDLFQLENRLEATTLDEDGTCLFENYPEGIYEIRLGPEEQIIIEVPLREATG